MNFNRDRNTDGGFGTDGLVITDLGGDEYANGMIVPPDGKILVAGR